MSVMSFRGIFQRNLCVSARKKNRFIPDDDHDRRIRDLESAGQDHVVDQEDEAASSKECVRACMQARDDEVDRQAQIEQLCVSRGKMAASEIQTSRKRHLRLTSGIERSVRMDHEYSQRATCFVAASPKGFCSVFSALSRPSAHVCHLDFLCSDVLSQKTLFLPGLCERASAKRRPQGDDDESRP